LLQLLSTIFTFKSLFFKNTSDNLSGLRLFDFICVVQVTTSAFRLLTAFVLVLFFLPDALQHGLFMDGVQYGVVAKNLAEGKGEFWFPFLSPSWSREGLTAFMEQPPLFYFLESLFFRLFGEHFLSEKMFCLFTLVLTAFLIHSIWKQLFHDQLKLQSFSWLPVLLWFLCPTVSWVHRNNLIESLLSVFVLGSVYFSLKGIQTSAQLRWLHLILAGFFVFCGSLCKGLPGLFPLLVPILYSFFYKSSSLKRSVFYALIVFFVPVLIYLCLWSFNSTAQESLKFYVEHRLINRIQNDPTVGNRFTVLLWLFLDLLPMLVLFILFMIKFRSRVTQLWKMTNTKQNVLLFFCIGLSGVLPLCLTRVQREMYYVPAVPFFSIALALIIAPALSDALAQLRQRLLRRLQITFAALLLLCLAYSFMLAGSDARDHEVLEDVREIGKLLGKNKTVSAPFEVYSRWDLQFYLLRYHNISISTENGIPRIYNKNQMPDTLNGYHKSELELKTLDLFFSDTPLEKQ
jgi:hypothetical protein